jgi:hypothetical protein
MAGNALVTPLRPTRELIDRPLDIFCYSSTLHLSSSHVQLTCLNPFSESFDYRDHGYFFPSPSRQHHWYTPPSLPSPYPAIADSLLQTGTTLASKSVKVCQSKHPFLSSSTSSNILPPSKRPHRIHLLQKDRPMDLPPIRHLTLPTHPRHGSRPKLRPTMLRRP